MMCHAVSELRFHLEHAANDEVKGDIIDVDAEVIIGLDVMVAIEFACRRNGIRLLTERELALAFVRAGFITSGMTRFCLLQTAVSR